MSDDLVPTFSTPSSVVGKFSPSTTRETEDGWEVRCRLCGEAVTRRLYATSSDMSAYWFEHVESEPHKAAELAFRQPPPPLRLTPEEELLNKIFGKEKPPSPPPSDRDRRRQAARNAARRAGLRKGRYDHRPNRVPRERLTTEQLTCLVCGYPVGLKKQAWSRLQRPDGGFDHTYCGLGESPMTKRAKYVGGEA